LQYYEIKATVKIVDTASDSEPSVVKTRDIQVTFEDGTTTTISPLIGRSVTDIRNLLCTVSFLPPTWWIGLPMMFIIKDNNVLYSIISSVGFALRKIFFKPTSIRSGNFKIIF
jgi:hypothetical protein